MKTTEKDKTAVVIKGCYKKGAYLGMGNSIYIKQFGPIDEIKFDLRNNMSVVIGPQASGKSTLAKAIYFCKKIRDYSMEFIGTEDIFYETDRNEIYVSLLKYIRKKYMENFGTTRHFSRQFRINYEYDDDRSVSIILDEKGYVKFQFSRNIESELKDLVYAVHDFYSNNRAQNTEGLVEAVLTRIKFKQDAIKQFHEAVYMIFRDSSPVIYIPAGRSLLSVMSDQMDIVDTSVLDLPMKDFVERIRSTKSRFGTKLDTVVADYLKTVKGQIKNADVEMALSMVTSILKADYVNDTDGEKLYIDRNRWVKLIYGSSGQQESLWILLLLFIIILENRKSYVIIEEPEAHLYPTAQRKIMEYIALTMNSSRSQMFITTHSPYIMTSANLLIYSGSVENKIKVKDAVVHKMLRLDPKTTIAYQFRESQPTLFESIMDSDGMIKAIEIDSISAIINQATDKIIDLEMQNDL